MINSCQFEAFIAGRSCKRCGFVLTADYPRGYYRKCPELQQAPSGISNRIESLLPEIGITQTDYAAFVKEAGKPPGCYDKRCWWLKKFAKWFGEEKAERIKDAMFGPTAR